MIPFSIPTEFVASLAEGNLIRVGTILKETGTGRIVAHLQETGIAQQLLSGIGGSPFLPLIALNLASSGYANVQLGQLKTMVQGLQSLQYLNLGVSIAGIGVSVIGFAMMNKRLKNIEGQIANLDEKLDQHFQVLFERELRRHYSQVYVLIDKADLAHSLTNSSAEWRSVASQLADESGYFLGEIGHLLKQVIFDTDLFTSLIRSLALCNAARIECLLLASELPAAHKAASVIGQNYKVLFDDMSPVQLASKVLPEHSVSNDYDYSRLCRNQLDMKALVQGVRDVTDAALTKPFLIETLIEKGIAGHDFILALREEKEHPLLLLRVDA